MTEDLNNGQLYTWMEAFEACRRRDWYLPCQGEIKFLLESYYSNSRRAYENWTGSSNRSLVETGQDAQFWTATESDDDSAWSFLFNPNTRAVELVRGTRKNKRLPCRCVQRNRTVKSTIPECYDKVINFRR